MNIFTHHVYAIGRVTCGVCGLWKHPSNFDEGDDVTLVTGSLIRTIQIVHARFSSSREAMELFPFYVLSILYPTIPNA